MIATLSFTISSSGPPVRFTGSEVGAPEIAARAENCKRAAQPTATAKTNVRRHVFIDTLPIVNIAACTFEFKRGQII
jgi:hypothetical protein